MIDVALLQLIRVKGLVNEAAIAAALGQSADAVQAACAAALSAGLLTTSPRGLRLTSAGRARLAELIAQERAGLDTAALDAAYGDFCAVNEELKAAIASWQMRDEATPNDHTDPGYDAAVIERLAAVDARAAPILARLAVLAPRLGGYGRRLSAALERVLAGDHGYVARPILDSYHTVWFELHEDLIAMTGRTRAAEAAAGRGA